MLDQVTIRILLTFHIFNFGKLLQMLYYSKFKTAFTILFVASLLVCVPTTAFSSSDFDSQNHSKNNVTEQQLTSKLLPLTNDIPIGLIPVNYELPNSIHLQNNTFEPSVRVQVQPNIQSTSESNTLIEINPNFTITPVNDLENSAIIAQLSDPLPQPSATSGTPTVAIFANDTSIVEGTSASFDVSRTGGDLTSSLRIELSITQMGNFIQGPAPTFMTIPANQIAWDLRIATENDTVVEDDGKVIATIDADARYTFDQTQTTPNRAEIIVTDNDSIKVAIFANDQSIVEGTAANFDVSRVGGDQTVALRIELSITQMGNFIQGTAPTFVNIPANRTAWDFSVPTEDDTVDEANGKIIATITANARYEFDLSQTSPNRAEINVTDNDEPPPGVKPSISLSGQSNLTISEGESVTISVNSNLGIEAPVTVNLNVDEGMNDFIPASQVLSATLTSFQTSTPFIVQTVKDSMMESTGTVTVSIATGSNYDIAANPNNSYTFTVTNSTGTPQLYITAVSGIIEEGQPAKFEISALLNFREIALATDLQVAISVETVGSFFDGATRTSHRFIKDKKKSILSIPTIEDSTYEVDGSIKVTLTMGAGYELHNILPSVATIKVHDNDVPSQGISVVAEKNIVTEGEYARFQITRPGDSTNTIGVRINVSEVSNFIFGTPVEEVVLNANQRTTIIEVETVDNTIDEENGLITLRILDDLNSPATYIKASTRNWASIEVLDNDAPTTGTLPTLSVATISPTSINEGESITVQFNSTKIIPAGFRFRVKINQNSPELASLSDPNTAEFLTFEANTEHFPYYIYDFPQGTSYFRHTFTTLDDIVDEYDGIISIEIVPDATKYLIDNLKKRVEVTVKDYQDAEPTFTLKLLTAANITEGATIRFNLETDNITTKYAKIRVFEGTSNFLHPIPMPGTQPTSRPSAKCPILRNTIATVNIGEAGEQTRELCVESVNDLVEEESSTITISVDASQDMHYNVNSKSSFTITVADNDFVRPTLTISLDTAISSDDFYESGYFYFKTISSVPVSRHIPVKIKVEQTGDFFDPDISTVSLGEQTTFHRQNTIETTGNISIFPLDDDVAEAHGQFTVTILESNQYVLGSQSSITIDVFDNDQPEGISIYEVKDAVTEGETAVFQITSDTMLTSQTTINISTTEVGDFIDQTNSNYPYNDVTMRSGRSYELLEIPTSENNDTADDGSITVTIQDSTLQSSADGYYTIASSNTSATINIKKLIPELSIYPTSIRVTEGHDFSFNVRSTPATTRELTIEFTPTPSDTSITYTPTTPPPPETLVIPVGSTSTTWTGKIAEAPDNSLVSIDISASSDNKYTVAADSTLAVTVLDNDNPTALLPKVAVVPVSDGVLAGSPATFKVIIDPPATRRVDVRYNVTLAGNFYSGLLSTRFITFPLRAASVDHVIMTEDPDDSMDNEDGLITLTLLEGSGEGNQIYALAEKAMSTAKIIVTDDEKPELSITANESEVNERDDVEFTITATTKLGFEYPIMFSISETGNFLTAESLAMNSIDSTFEETDTDMGKTEVIETTLSLTTKPADTDIEPNSDVTVTLEDGTHYTISNDSSANVTIEDENIPSGGFSIVAFSDSITEGELAKFQIRTNSAVVSQTTVSVSLDDGERGSIIGASTRNVVFEIDEKSKDLEINTTNFPNFTVTGFIKATLTASNDYSIVESNKSDEILVKSDESVPSLPRVSIASAPNVTEGQKITVNFITTPPSPTFSFPSGGIPISINVQQSGGNFILSTSDLGGRTITLLSNSHSLEIPTQVVKGRDTGLVNIKINLDPESVDRYLPADYPNATTQITINDNNQPTPTISLAPGTIQGTTTPITSVTEGDNPAVIFQLDQPATYDFVINYRTSEVGSFLEGGAGLRQQNVVVNDQNLSVPIKTEDDDAYELNGSIAVEIAEGESYNFNMNNRRVEIAVEDNDTAEIFVAIDAPVSVVEGDDIAVILTATSTSDTQQTIMVDLQASNNTGTYLNYTNSLIEIIAAPNTSTNKSVSIPTSKIMNSSEGAISLFIVPTNEYDVTSTTPTSVKVIAKEVLPEITITRTSPAAIQEGETAQFTVSTTDTLSTNLPVSILVSQGEGEDFISETSPITATLDMSSKTDLVEVMTLADTNDEDDGTITVAIQEDPKKISRTMDATYLRGSPNSASITIQDNDVPVGAPIITVTGLNEVIEGDDATFTFSTDQLPANNNEINVHYQITQVGDFLAPFTTPDDIDITSSGSASLKLPTMQDAITEENGSVTIQLIADTEQTPTYSVGSTYVATTTLIDDDNANLPSVTIVLANPSVTTITEGASNAEFIINSSSASSNSTPLEVEVRITQTGDFLDKAMGIRKPMITIGTPHPLTEMIADDEVDELDGSITARLQLKSSKTYAIGMQQQATINVLDDEEVPEISITAVADEEGTEQNSADYNTFAFNVTLDRASNKDITVDFAFGKVGDSAKLGETEDYTHTYDTPAKRVLTFVNASSENINDRKETITVTIIGDSYNEVDERFTVTLSNPTNAKFANSMTQISTTGTIENDDPVPSISFASSTAESSEGMPVNFPVSLSAPSGQDITISYTLADGSATIADNDYVNPVDGKRTLMIPAKSMGGTISVKTTQDMIDELDENFSITLEDPADTSLVTLGTPNTATGTILNDGMPTLSIESKTVGEDVGMVTLKVKLASPRSSAISVLWKTINGTALAGSDFTSKSGTLEFDGTNTDKEKEIVIAILDDSNDEDNQAFTVQLENVTGVTRLNNGIGTITITDDDAEPMINIATVTDQIEDDGAVSPNTPADTLYNIDVTLNDGTAAKASDKTVSIGFTVTPGTAVLTHDYELINSSNTLTFDPGITMQQIMLRIKADNMDEDDENFSVRLTTVTNAQFATSADSAQSITITDNDDPSVFSIENVTVTEGVDTGGMFVITQTPASGKTVSVDVAIADGTATAGMKEDYEISGPGGNTRTLEFEKVDTPADSVTQNIAFTIRDDNLDEADETFTATLSNQTQEQMPVLIIPKQLVRPQ